MTDSPDLARFLLDRYEEDERQARAAIDAHREAVERFIASRPDDIEHMDGETAADWDGGTNEDGNSNFWCGVWAGEGITSICRMDNESDTDTAEYIARWDPAAVLADVEAKRKLVREAEVWLEDSELAASANRVLLLLAQPFRDHADFHYLWRLDD